MTDTSLPKRSLSTPCDGCLHAYNWHASSGSCDAPSCGCTAFQDAGSSPASGAAHASREPAEALRWFRENPESVDFSGPDSVAIAHAAAIVRAALAAEQRPRELILYQAERIDLADALHAAECECSDRPEHEAKRGVDYSYTVSTVVSAGWAPARARPSVPDTTPPAAADPRTDVFLAKLDRMVNEDRIDDSWDVRAALDEAQATIRRLRSAPCLRDAGEALYTALRRFAYAWETDTSVKFMWERWQAAKDAMTNYRAVVPATDEEAQQ